MSVLDARLNYTNVHQEHRKGRAEAEIKLFADVDEH